MNRPTTPLVFGVLLVFLGLGWLLNESNVTPEVDWIWTLGFAVVGLLVLFCRGLNKASIVVGPLLIACAVFSYVRQTGYLAPDYELPILLVVSGLLVIISYYAPLPPPRWLVEPPDLSERPRTSR